MKDWFDMRDMKIAMLETLLEMKPESTITDFCTALLAKFTPEDKNDADPA